MFYLTPEKYFVSLGIQNGRFTSDVGKPGCQSAIYHVGDNNQTNMNMQWYWPQHKSIFVMDSLVNRQILIIILGI